METSTLTVFRYDPTDEHKPRYDHYEIPFDPFATVLDSLSSIQERVDRTLSFRGECGYQMCGTCAVRMNGRAVLACNTKVQREMLIEPLAEMPLIKDLVVDRRWIYERVNPARPFFVRRGDLERQPEPMPAEVYELHAAAATCIECYICTISCPLYDQGTDPASNLKIARVALDERDGLPRVDALAEFVSKCVVCGTCTGVCPLEVRVDRLVLSAREKLVQERGLSLVKRAAIQLTNIPTLLWTLVRIGYPLRGVLFRRDRESFPALAKEKFQLRDTQE